MSTPRPRSAQIRIATAACLLSLIVAACGDRPPEAAAEPPSSAGPGPVRLDGRLGAVHVTADAVYVGTGDGRVHAFQRDTGRERWSAQTGGPVVHPPAVLDDRILVGSQDGTLYAFDRDSGETLWTFRAGAIDWPVRDIFINGTPAIVHGLAVFSSEDFNVYAVDATTGEERWCTRLGEEPQALQIPIHDGIAYIGAWDGQLYALSVADGHVVWRSDTDSDRDGTTVRTEDGLRWRPREAGGETLPNQAPYVTVVPLIIGDHVYFSDWSGNLMAVERATGTQVWRFRPRTADRRHVGSRHFLTHLDDVIFYSTLEDGRLFGVNRFDGTVAWEWASDHELAGPYPAQQHIAFVGELRLDDADRGVRFQLRAFDMRARAFIWSLPDVASPGNVRDGVAYFGGTDGTVRGVDIESGQEVYRLGA